VLMKFNFHIVVQHHPLPGIFFKNRINSVHERMGRVIEDS
jgi:hypothetical protein